MSGCGLLSDGKGLIMPTVPLFCMVEWYMSFRQLYEVRREPI